MKINLKIKLGDYTMFFLLLFISVVFYGILFNLILDNDTSAYQMLKVSPLSVFLLTFLFFLNAGFCLNMDNKILQVLACLCLCVLLLNAYCDQKTKLVYRIYNILYIFLCTIYGIASMFLLHYSIEQTIAIGLTWIGTIIIVLLLSSGKIKIFHTMGLGDGLALIGTSIFLLSFIHQDGYFPVEYILVHFIVATVFMVICTIHKFDFKHMKFKEDVAFLPYIYVSIFITAIIFLLI